MRDLATELFNAISGGLPESSCTVEHRGQSYEAVCGGVTLSEAGSEFGLSLGPASLVRLSPAQPLPPVSIGEIIELHYMGESAKCRITSIATTGGMVRYNVEAVYARA